MAINRFTSASDMKLARRLGSAKNGREHWWWQRVTAVSNFGLVIWLLLSLVLLPSFDRGTVVTWIAQPIVTILLLLLILSTFWHARLGFQVFIEDYVHDTGLKLLALVALSFFLLFLGAIAAYSVLTIAFGAF